MRGKKGKQRGDRAKGCWFCEIGFQPTVSFSPRFPSFTKSYYDDFKPTRHYLPIMLKTEGEGEIQHLCLSFSPTPSSNLFTLWLGAFSFFLFSSCFLRLLVLCINSSTER
eukprot:TRINITY_DN3320_c1_g1_i1.p1 TRINITY_DN3320_c1_g1~~TRINITY_DN3320_c1_g1_i1.p1  ORF type:complete len:110 (-),score=4.66 TRINITY_DN3320_c1_g1_i1:81-410(-)